MEKLRALFKIHIKEILIGIGLIFIPFIIEFILVCTPQISDFSNETWFSFLGSYIGCIVTILVMKYTINETDKRQRSDLKKSFENYKIEQEIEKTSNLMDLLLLDKYNFSNISSIIYDYNRLVMSIFDSQYDKKAIYDPDNIVNARDKFLKLLYDLEGMQRVYLISTLMNPIEDKNEVYKETKNNIQGLQNMANHYRVELRLLYQAYKEEMELKMFNEK